MVIQVALTFTSEAGTASAAKSFTNPLVPSQILAHYFSPTFTALNAAIHDGTVD
jgi:hypothetical protein